MGKISEKHEFFSSWACKIVLLQMHLLVMIETICAAEDNLLRDDSKKILFQGTFNLLVPFHDSRIFNLMAAEDDDAF